MAVRPTAPQTGVERMAALIDQVDRQADPQQDRFLNRRRAKLIQSQLQATTDPRQQVMLLQQLTLEWMNAGETENALAAVDRMTGLLRRHDPQNQSGLRDVPNTLKAITYLRLGEVQNCCATASPDACLLPIQGTGIHTRPEGSRKAITLLNTLLKSRPDDLGLRWLLNIAYMTLGEYPAKVPRQWLLPPESFRSDYNLPRFKNIAPKLGLDVQQLAGGVLMDDFDNDGDLDLMISSFGLNDEMHYFVHNADGTFTDRTKEAGLIGERGGQNLIQADFNNDGNLDFLILRGGWRGAGGKHPRSLVQNNGDGTFSDVTEESGIQTLVPCMTAIWFDYNNDGWLDLFFGNESAEGMSNPCQLFKNNGDNTFTEVAAEAGVDLIAYAKAAVALDYNNDHLQDFYVSCWNEPNRLFKNLGPDTDGKWRFEEVGLDAGVTEPLGSFSCFAFDYDNDGWEDIFVTDYDIQSVADVVADYLGQETRAERARLFHNKGDGTFEDVTRQAHLNHVIYGMGINFGDLDNDGWLDFYVGTGAPNLSALIPNRMFRNADGKFFQDVTTAGNFGHLQKGHGIAFGDLNGDGAQEIFASMGGAFEGDTARAVLFENPGNRNSFIKLKLVGKTSCRDAHGARIKIIGRTPDGAVRTLYRTVGSGGSFGGNPLRQEIGLGRITQMERIEITWPRTGKTQILSPAPPGAPTKDNVYTITEQ